MAVTIADIQKLRKMTGAGLADCKKALTEADGDIEKAIELVRERGLAIAAKRSDRETSNGCVLVKSTEGFAAMIAVKCETDFVANGKEFIDMTAEILDAAIAAKAQSLDEVKKLALASGNDAETAVKLRSGVTGEKMELDGYNFLEGENISVYDHMGKHTLCTMVQLNENNEEAGHKVAMQVAAMRPVALDESSVSEETKKKDHIESNTKKGWLTPEQAEEARQIKKTVGEEKAASLNETMVQNIANGRLAKFFKENCLVDQEFQFGDGDKQTVSQFLASQSKTLKITAYKRFTLAAE